MTLFLQGLHLVESFYSNSPPARLHGKVSKTWYFFSFVCSSIHSFVSYFFSSFVWPFVLSFLRPFVPSSLRPFVPSSLRLFFSSFLRSFVPSFFRSSFPASLRPFVFVSFNSFTRTFFSYRHSISPIPIFSLFRFLRAFLALLVLFCFVRAKNCRCQMYMYIELCFLWVSKTSKSNR